MSRKPVAPIIFLNRLVVLLGVCGYKMSSEIRVSGDEFVLLGDATNFPASLLEGEVAIRNAVLTCITCRPCAWVWNPLGQLEV
jgi:hypothetical protein